jgi:ribosomal silencing factor RsfS
MRPHLHVPLNNTQNINEIEKGDNKRINDLSILATNDTRTHTHNTHTHIQQLHKEETTNPERDKEMKREWGEVIEG